MHTILSLQVGVTVLFVISNVSPRQRLVSHIGFTNMWDSLSFLATWCRGVVRDHVPKYLKFEPEPTFSALYTFLRICEGCFFYCCAFCFVVCLAITSVQRVLGVGVKLAKRPHTFTREEDSSNSNSFYNIENQLSSTRISCNWFPQGSTCGQL